MKYYDNPNGTISIRFNKEEFKMINLILFELEKRSNQYNIDSKEIFKVIQEKILELTGDKDISIALKLSTSNLSITASSALDLSISKYKSLKFSDNDIKRFKNLKFKDVENLKLNTHTPKLSITKENYNILIEKSKNINCKFALRNIIILFYHQLYKDIFNE